MNDISKYVNKKYLVVLLAYTTAEPRAMVIEFFNAIITYVTMTRPGRSEYITSIAVTYL